MRILISGSTASLRRAIARVGSDHLGILLTPAGRRTPASASESGLPWAADNGAFSNFDPGRFATMAAACRGLPGLLWVAVPDVVADARATLERFDEWLPRLPGLPLAFVGQDGIEDLPIPWIHFDALFLGGSTDWKLSRAAYDLAIEAKDQGKLVHMGRVNTLRRLRIANAFECDTVDGTACSRFGDHYIADFSRYVRGLLDFGA